MKSTRVSLRHQSTSTKWQVMPKKATLFVEVQQSKVKLNFPKTFLSLKNKIIIIYKFIFFKFKNKYNFKID